jgi:XTP/dITP diphosphohydrolase
VELVLGSRNAHKLRELSALLEPHRLLELPAEVRLPAETGTTFAQNAAGKARASAQATGRAALGEDSGIAVAALGGAPGVRSSRFAGEDATDQENLAKLLRATDGAADRRAAYHCALVYAEPGGEERLFEARCEGTLATAPRGSGGFGYDPIFIPAGIGGGTRTMAELLQSEKDEVSHRGRAARLLLAWLDARTSSSTGANADR